MSTRSACSSERETSPHPFAQRSARQAAQKYTQRSSPGAALDCAQEHRALQKAFQLGERRPDTRERASLLPRASRRRTSTIEKCSGMRRLNETERLYAPLRLVQCYSVIYPAGVELRAPLVRCFLCAHVDHGAVVASGDSRADDCRWLPQVQGNFWRIASAGAPPGLRCKSSGLVVCL